LFSITDINVSEYSFQFQYKRNEDNKYFEVNKEDLNIQAVGNIVYFLVMGDFFTGFHYDFEIRMISLNGDIVWFDYKNISVRGKF